jgi:hypothetical protein
MAALALGASVPEAAAAAPYDFNGDGYQELVAGMRDLADGRIGQAGAVLVVPGSPKGPVLRRRRMITQSTPGVPDESEREDVFGRRVASGDFDGDGYADLAVAAMESFASEASNEGAVTIMYGSRRGLTGTRAAQLAGDVAAPGTDGDVFGESLEAGDLDRDGFADLVVGAPPEWSTPGGHVRVFFGSRLGVTPERERRLPGPNPQDVDFGALLALGDVNRDGHLDLVEGSPGSGEAWGHLSYCAGGPDGPTSCRTVSRRSGPREGIVKRPPDEPNSLAVGDVTGDGYPDVVEGAPAFGWTHENWTPGAVLIRRGTVRGPSQRRRKVDQTTVGLPARACCFNFGNTVAVGRLDADRHADVIVGFVDAQAVGVLRGARSGVRRRGVPILAPPQSGSYFGTTVGLLDHNGDGRLDLTVGDAGQDTYTDLGPKEAYKMGTLHTYPGRRGGFDLRRPRRIDSEALGLPPRAWTGLGRTLGR